MTILEEEIPDQEIDQSVYHLIQGENIPEISDHLHPSDLQGQDLDKDQIRIHLSTGMLVIVLRIRDMKIMKVEVDYLKQILNQNLIINLDGILHWQKLQFMSQNT